MRTKTFHILDTTFCMLTGIVVAIGFVFNLYFGAFLLSYAILFHILRWFYYWDEAAINVKPEVTE